MKLKLQILKSVERFKNTTFFFFAGNAALVLLQYLYITLRFKYMNAVIPFWYTKPWGDLQLADKTSIYLVPVICAVLLLIGLVMIFSNKYFILYLPQVIIFTVTAANIVLTYSVLQIIRVASSPFPPLIDPLYTNLFLPFTLAFLCVYFLLPFFIDYAFRHRLVTNPKLHAHPAMLLEKPSARGGGFFYAVIFLTLTFMYVGFNKNFIGFYVSLLMVAFLGIVDDFQNTHPMSTFKTLENPFLRLFLLFISVLPVVLSGIKINYVNNPFMGGILNLNQFTLRIDGSVFPIISALVTAIWIVWVLNVLSWSNGIDGQYAGIVGIASITIAILALRFDPLLPVYKQLALMAAISAGAAFGFVRYTWHPSQIMWGFGAMTAGLVLATLSISISSKIVTSILIILIPFLDALITVIRRLLQRKNPLSGDRGHLHHLLLARGWSVNRIALFYWGTTALFGVIGLLTAEIYTIQTSLILAGIVSFFIVLLNLLSIKGTRATQTPEK